jgi:hypothetical protein
MCAYESSSLERYGTHAVRQHQFDPNFIVHCSFKACSYSTKSWGAFKAHVSRKHRISDYNVGPSTSVIADQSCKADDGRDDICWE